MKDTSMNEICKDIAVIKNQITNLSERFTSYGEQQDAYIKSLNDLQVKTAGIESKLTTISVFQSTLSIVIGAVAAFLGVSKK